MSGIDASAVVTWHGWYPSGSVAGCMPIPALGWHHTLPPAVLIDQRLEAHQNDFLTMRWLTDGFGPADPRAAKHLFRLHRYGDIAVIDDGRVVCSPASLAGQWEVTVERVFAAVRAAPTPYPTIIKTIGNSMTEISVQTCLQRLCDDGRVAGHTAADKSDWSTISFSRTAASEQSRP